MSGYTFPTSSVAEPFYNPYNPDFLSRVWRARNTAGEMPTSSVLSEVEWNLLYVPTFDISGSVVSASSAIGLENITITFTGIESAPNYTAYTDANGWYNQSVMTYWSGSVTPSSASATFTPTTVAVSEVVANQTIAAFSSSF